MIITLEHLKKLGACTPKQRWFEKLYPNGVEVTRALCIEHARSVPWHWWVGRLHAVEEAVLIDAFNKSLEKYRAVNKCLDAAYSDLLQRMCYSATGGWPVGMAFTDSLMDEGLTEHRVDAGWADLTADIGLAVAWFNTVAPVWIDEH